MIVRGVLWLKTDLFPSRAHPRYSAILIRGITADLQERSGCILYIRPQDYQNDSDYV